MKVSVHSIDRSLVDPGRVIGEGDRQSGIALIMLLGILSILVILGVAFTTSMRTERLAARNFAQAIQARNLVYSGLTMAQEQLHYTLTNSAPPDAQFYPLWATLPSDQGPQGNGQILENSEGLTDDEIQKFIPADLWGAVQAAAGGAVRWNHVVDPNDPAVALGRVSYLIVDSTGLMDVHELHRSPREIGVDANELRLNFNLLSEFTSQGRADNTPGQVDYYTRFETLPELLNLGRNSGSGFQMFTGGAAIENLFVHSRGAQGFWDTAAEQADDAQFVGANVDQTSANLSAIEDAITRMGGVAQPDFFALNIRDYIDVDDVPGNGAPNALRSFCTERVPMINEMKIKHRIKADGGGPQYDYSQELEFDVELWYPFAQSSSSNYFVQVFAVTQGSDQSDFEIDSETVDGPVQAGCSPGSFYEPGTVVAAGGTYSSTNAPSESTQFGAFVRVRNSDTDTIVDEVIVRGQFNAVFNTSVPPGGGAPSEDDNTREVNDPRINFDWADGAQWRDLGDGDPAPGSSFGAINPYATGATAGGATADQDGRPEMYVENGPMQTVGQFGDLLYDASKPWETIPLLDIPDDNLQIATYLRVQSNEFRTAVINPNTRNDAVLDSAWYALPRALYPGHTGGTPLTQAQATTVADAVRNLRDGLWAGAPDDYFINVGEICRTSSATLPGATRMEKEMLMRNTIGMFNTRNHFYTVIIDAEVGIDDTTGGTGTPGQIDDGEVTAKQKAIAVIWKDPFATEPGRGYASKLKTFKWLTE